jgi:soluble lytic murein transglycosylase-like protein
MALLIVGGGRARADVLEISDSGTMTVVSAADRAESRLPLGTSRVLPYAGALKIIALRNGVSPILFEAVVWEESRWNAAAISRKGAVGLSQLMPKTAQELGVDPYDPIANLAGGARYLKIQLDRFGDLELALAAYCAGPERVAAIRGVPPIREVHTYIDAIITRIANTHSAL